MVAAQIVYHLWPDVTPTKKDMPGILWAFFGTISHLEPPRTHTLQQVWRPPHPPP